MSNGSMSRSEAAEPVARTLEWAQVDVFADRPYEGNMLAIFPDATGLSDAEMQAIARETNLSETTFVLPRGPETERREGVRVRIFTVEEELPFAGHPTLGTASWLRLNRPEFAGAEAITLQLNLGPVPVRFPAKASAYPGGIVAEMLQKDPEFLGEVEPGRVADAVALDPAGMHAELRPEVVSTGLPFLVAALASVDALAAVRPDFARVETLLRGTAAKFLYLIAPNGKEPCTWRARLPFYRGEDPATGSAAGCAISLLVARGAAESGTPVTILQGEFVHRPSRIVARASFQRGRVFQVRVQGCTIPVATGRFLRP